MDYIDKKDPMEHKNFWDSLQMDIIASNQNLSNSDYQMYVEQNFMFSLFYRGCTPLEISCFQKMFGILEYAYLILFEISEPDKPSSTGSSISDIDLYRLIKRTLPSISYTVGPMIADRFSVLISHDSMLEEQEQIEESLALSKELSEKLEAEYDVTVKVGIGTMQSLNSIYSSFLDALACMYHNTSNNISHYLDCKNAPSNTDIDYLETEKHMIEAIRLRKPEAYDYLGIILEGYRQQSDEIKRNKIIEILVLTNHAMLLDSASDIKQISYTSYINKIMELSGNDLIEFAFQSFIFITSYVKPQNTIDYTNHIVKATREYLEVHYTDDISLEDMAAQVNISPQYFSKLIKKTTGFNFIDWLSMLRVKRAKELLTNSNLTVKEVCFMVGYKDPNYFSRIFKKRIGITPSEYVKTSSYLNNKS